MTTYTIQLYKLHENIVSRKSLIISRFFAVHLQNGFINFCLHSVVKKLEINNTNWKTGKVYD